MVNKETKKDICPACGADRNFDYKPVISLFKLWNDDIKINTAAKVLTGRLIKLFGYEAVREAFIQACVEEDRMTLAYVRGILLKKNQANAARESVEEANRLKEDTRIISKQNNFFETGEK